MCGKNENCSCIKEVLETILCLQKKQSQGCDNDTCTKPFLGPTPNIICFNTRPISLYSCCDNNLWSFPFTLNGTTGESTVFRIESLDDCCATCRVLAPNPDTTNQLQEFVATNSYFTINLKCVGAITCHNDISIDCL